LDAVDDIGPALKEIELPAVIKPYESWVERDGKGARLSPNLVTSESQARAVLEEMFSLGGRALLQQWLPGRREAVTLFYAHGRIWARLAQVSHREWPVLGGVSVLCETIPLLPDITSDAERLVRAMELEGCSMVEFRRDRHGRPVLMEVNPRMGGSVGLAIAAGVDFPSLLYRWKLDGELEEVSSYRVGKRLRWLAGDIWNLKCVYESQGHPDAGHPLNATGTFLLDFLRPASTGIDLSDLRPAVAEVNKMVLRHGVHRVRRVLSATQLHHVGKMK
jgi:predicted ATP-grasp superfamily ATP-dependent carboligase